jgi:hypothetical protein
MNKGLKFLSGPDLEFASGPRCSAAPLFPGPKARELSRYADAGSAGERQLCVERQGLTKSGRLKNGKKVVGR